LLNENQMSKLFTPINIGGLTLDNRIIVAPMCQYSAIDGKATDWHLIHIGQMAMSGAGLFIIEATAVSPEGRISYADLGLWSDETTQALKRILDSIRSYSSMPIGIQLGHAGRKASSALPWQGGGQIAPDDPRGWDPVAPSAVAISENCRPPNTLTCKELKSIKKAFVEAAKRSVSIGIQLIEIHAAHGYLLHQFLSPLTNQRTDEYGGTLEKRMRFPLEVFNAIRSEIPSEIPVGIRISATDWVDGGFDLNESVPVCQAMETAGADFIHVSSGGLSNKQKITVAPSYQVPLASSIRAHVNIPVIAVGLINDALQAEDILQDHNADCIAIARAILSDPHWPWHAAEKLGAKIKAPPQYWRSEPENRNGTFLL
jgi:2,4-dienoyl-CoA reductase-like NADH-dependent reductase (Old Yellow Enzyme family)